MRARAVACPAVTLALAALAVMTLLSGCSGPAPAPAPSTEISVALYQGRTDYARNVFAIEVANAGSTPLTVRSARLRSASFTEEAVYDGGEVTVSAGDRVDLRMPIPPVACTGPAELGIVTVVLDSGRTLSLTPSDPNLVVERLVREGCIVHDVDAIVRITPPPALRIDGPQADAHLDLTVTPTGAKGSAELQNVRSTTLLSPIDGSAGWPLGVTVDAASEPRTITLDMRPTRCDPHALADDKVGTILVIDVAASTGRSGRYLLPLPPALKEQVYGYIATYCGH